MLIEMTNYTIQFVDIEKANQEDVDNLIKDLKGKNTFVKDVTKFAFGKEYDLGWFIIFSKLRMSKQQVREAFEKVYGNLFNF